MSWHAPEFARLPPPVVDDNPMPLPRNVLVNGRPVVVVDSYYDGPQEHGYIYRFASDPVGGERWIPTGDPRMTSARHDCPSFF